MTLIGFHRFLIVCGILFCLGYAGWEGRAFLESGGVGTLLLALAFLGLAGLLASYLRRLNRWLGYGEEGRLSAESDEGTPPRVP